MDKNVKFQLFVPKSHLDIIRLALGEAGIGKIGHYDYCSFVSTGKGYFRPLDGSDPSVGVIGHIEEVEEVKLEFVCPESEIEKVIEIIKENHPYEEIAVDIFPLIGAFSIKNPKPKEKTRKQIGFKAK